MVPCDVLNTWVFLYIKLNLTYTALNVVLPKTPKKFMSPLDKRTM